ncbi:MAG TPA: hypothetical protein VK508_19565 [Cyclobacteriaceae bacterium]|nr:hypothetical protein [Cyclobacteriaceae bacterium]
MHTLYLILKTFHILSFVIIIGITLANVIAYHQFWKIYEQDHAKGIATFAIIRGFFKAGMIGMIVVLLAGISMLAISEWSFVQLLWFKIKLGLIGLIFVNGLTLGRTSAMKVQALVEGGNTTNDPAELSSIQSRTRLFLILQLLIFVTIIILSVFRFT